MTQVGGRETTRAFNATLVERYFELGESPASIARTAGRSVSMVTKLVKDHVKTHGPRERKRIARMDPRLMSSKTSLSPKHLSIGMRIARYMAERDMSATSFGMSIPASRSVVNNMIAGAHDFTIIDLYKLSEVLGISFSDLVSV